ncbi:divergent protein kinase domain 1B-like [Ylistrum balloti]|uniref:divergent protein kinase domain 1B-like n=1 Tax=Ylistrum balloti TaxID=509963 RepID=UPI002905A680|nr:divergent protein kinase domain 1B-like [Ylistrum balloti]
MRISLRPACLRRTSRLINAGCRLSDWWQRISYYLSKLLAAAVWVCERDLWKLLVGFFFLVLLFVLSLWYLLKDPCETTAATQHLCEEYERGYVSGTLCYDLCISRTFVLPRCLSMSGDIMTFHSKKSVAKFKVPPRDGATMENDKFNIPFHLHAQEGRLTNEDFHHLLERFIISRLGPVDVTELIERIYNFADASHDGKLNFGEANSIWELIHIHEFFILFLFQGDATFPVINATCGSLYTYDKAFIPALYDKKNKGFLDRIFSNTYRWSLPRWDKRVNVAVGLLENVASLSERGNAQFHMCNVNPTKYGYTEKFEAKLTYFEDIVSQNQFELEVKGQPCFRDRDCFHGDCVMECDTTTGTCTGVLKQPTLVQMCKIIEEYLVFDAPSEVKAALKVLLSKCKALTSSQEKAQDPTYAVQYNLLLDELSKFLWDQIKSKPVSWLDLPKKKAAPS